MVLAVSDDGCGMDRATLDHLFEPFFTTKEVGKGTGLGLAMVHGIVRQSGGRIVVLSEPGLGTTFKIYLPRVDAAPTAQSSEHPEPASGGTGTVLLVEDESVVRKLAKTVLQRAGYKVLQAENGEQALRTWLDHRRCIDPILTDCSMPLMGGRERVRRLQEDSVQVPILYMSGYTDDPSTEDEASGIKLLSKPFTPEALLAQVGSALGGC